MIFPPPDAALTPRPEPIAEVGLYLICTAAQQEQPLHELLDVVYCLLERDARTESMCVQTSVLLPL